MQLDTISRKVTRLRDTLALEAQMSEREHGLVRRLLVAPDAVSREDVRAVAVWELVEPAQLPRRAASRAIDLTKLHEARGQRLGGGEQKKKAG